MGQIKQKSATALDAALLKVSWKQRWKNYVLKLIPFSSVYDLILFCSRSTDVVSYDDFAPSCQCDLRGKSGHS